MIGASKINPNTDDLQRLFEMFDMGLNNSQIERIYRTTEGHQLSRIHISCIRRGKRWDYNKHSFMMKDEMMDSKIVETEVEGDKYQSIISICYTKSPIDNTLEKTYFISHYKNSERQMIGDIDFSENKPSDEQLLIQHNTFVFDDIFGI